MPSNGHIRCHKEPGGPIVRPMADCENCIHKATEGYASTVFCTYHLKTKQTPANTIWRPIENLIREKEIELRILIQNSRPRSAREVRGEITKLKNQVKMLKGANT